MSLFARARRSVDRPQAARPSQGSAPSSPDGPGAGSSRARYGACELGGRETPARSGCRLPSARRGATRRGETAGPGRIQPAALGLLGLPAARWRTNRSERMQTIYLKNRTNLSFVANQLKYSKLRGTQPPAPFRRLSRASPLRPGLVRFLPSLLHTPPRDLRVLPRARGAPPTVEQRPQGSVRRGRCGPWLGRRDAECRRE